MELKSGATALSAASLLFLALAALTGGIVFYAAFAAAAIAFAVDFCRYASAWYSLTKKLRVDRLLSRTDLLLGSSLTVTYGLDYSGRRAILLQCRQPVDQTMDVKEDAIGIDLLPGRQELTFTITPASRGKYVIGRLHMGFESFFFRGTLAAGAGDTITVYPPITVRPGRTAGRSSGRLAGGEAIREGSGTDFSRLREYTPGDSIRHVDWARTSKYGDLVVKDFEDVRSMPVFLLIDVDSSMETKAARNELDSAIDLATVLSGRVLLENERIGAACFSSSDVTAFLPLAGGQPQMARLRQFLASAQAVRGTVEPREGGPALQDAMAARKAFGKGAGLEAFGDLMDEAIRQFTVNVKEDGLIKAIFKVSRASGVPCHIIIATNLSMGLSSLLNGIRIARYYGHNVTVALTPHIWYEPPEGLDAERYYRKYREAADNIACLRSQKVEVVELSAAERPEEALRSDRGRRSVRTVR
jgi:uncharacterized protein (DUF58 family)